VPSFSAATTMPSTTTSFTAVMPYPGCAGCLGGAAAFDALTSTTSHELCEAITDPIPGQGWYDDNNGEIGDILRLANPYPRRLHDPTRMV